MPRETLTHDDDASFAEELEKQSDRGVAIIGAAYLDAKLGDVLQAMLGEHLSKSDIAEMFDGPNAPLGSFSSRIRMAYALGLIGPKTRADLNLIRQVRNDFAHKLKVRSFDDPAVRERCRNLALADRMMIAEMEPPTNPRHRFIKSVVLSLHLMYGELRRGLEIVNHPRVSP